MATDHVIKNIIKNIVDRISTTKHERAEKTKSIAQTAENMFSVRELVQGLESALQSKFPEQKLNASLGAWTEIANGATNTITLKDGETGREKEIKLQMQFGQADVIIDGKIVNPDQKFNVLAQYIVDFFTQ
jgi:hypothetical protein